MSQELRTDPIAPEVTMHRRSHPIELYVAPIVAVVLANLTFFFGGLMSGWWQPHAHSLQLIAAISKMNLQCSILPRQHWMVNLISATATRAPVTWPRLPHRRLAQHYQVGGMHVGGAVSGSLWYALHVALLAPAWLVGEFGYDDASVTLAGVVLAVLLAMCVLATPGFRTRHHDVFEASHRFGI